MLQIFFPKRIQCVPPLLLGICFWGGVVAGAVKGIIARKFFFGAALAGGPGGGVGLLGICFLRGVPEDVVEEIGEGEKGG
jgi:hypothetical protein